MLSAILIALVIASPAPSCPPDSEVTVTTLVQPGTVSLADATKFTGNVAGVVEVHITPSGAQNSASIFKSTGNMQLDQALLWAAHRSTYSPKISNCTAVEGTYIYRYSFAPNKEDISKTTTRFTNFFTTVLSTKAAPRDPTVALDPNLTSTESLHLIALYFSTLGAFHELKFLGDDFVQDLHRYHYRAVFDHGSSVLMFVLGNGEQLVGFVNEG